MCFCVGFEVIGLVLGAYLLYDGTKKYSLLQKIQNIPTSKVESAAVGLVELFGKAKCEREMLSPISKEKCVFWHIKAQYFYSGRHPGWRVFYQRESSERFYLTDETGRILVDLIGAQVEIPIDNVYQGYIAGSGVFGVSHQKMDERVLKFIDGLQDTDLKSKFMQRQHHDVQVIESYISEDDPIYVLGSAEPREAVTSSVGYENLIVKKGRDDIMYITDTHEKGAMGNLRSAMLWRGLLGFLLAGSCLLIILCEIFLFGAMVFK